MRIASILSIPLALTGCDTLEQRACTDVGCGDGVQITLHTQDNTLPNGSYAFEFTFAGAAHSCRLNLPDDLPTTPGVVGTLSCEPFLDVNLRPETVCSTQRTRDAVSQSCVPVAGHWLIDTHQNGTPNEVSVRVTRDGTSILDVNRTPEYKESRPNGPECEPVCKQTEIDLVLD